MERFASSQAIERGFRAFVRYQPVVLRSRCLWMFLLANCLAIGICGVAREFALRGPVLNDPKHSIRSVASQHLSIPDGLERLSDVLRQVPADAPVVFFGSSQEWDSSETYLLMSYLAWPRRVWFVATDASGGRTVGLPPPAAEHLPGALAFFAVAPPPEIAATAQPVGPKLKVWVRP